MATKDVETKNDPIPNPLGAPLDPDALVQGEPLDSPLQKSLVLIGLMGAGKSVVGRRLSHALDLPFVDADSAIEEAAGCSVSEIFARYGEQGFRDGEARVLARLLNGPRCVLATGGGAYMNADTRTLISRRGLAIWLRADLDLLVKRTAGRTHRPLLNQGNPREILADLMEKRYPIYEQADIIFDVSDESPDSTCRRLIERLTIHGAIPTPEN